METRTDSGVRTLGQVHAQFEMELRGGQSQAEQIEHQRKIAARALADIELARREPSEFNQRLADFCRGVLSRCDA